MPGAQTLKSMKVTDTVNPVSDGDGLFNNLRLERLLLPLSETGTLCDCKSNRRCVYCNAYKKHHRSLCTKKYKDKVNEETGIIAAEGARQHHIQMHLLNILSLFIIYEFTPFSNQMTNGN
jgi:hypothetical protein